MRFFLPKRLVELEYFYGDDEPDLEYLEQARPYQNEIDFAFFAVNFGYSKSDYMALTPAEKRLIYKAWENKTVDLTTLIYKACFTAYYNVRRGKKKRALKLFTKRRVRKANIDLANNNLNIVKKSQEIEGDSWIKKIYKANGMPFKKRKEGGKNV